MAYALMSRFYGFEPEYLSEMPSDLFNAYYLSIDIISSREQIKDLSNREFSHNMKADARDKHLSKLDKKAYPNKVEKVLTTEDFVKEISHGWQTK